MSGTLARVLRLRSLFEDVSRLELEKQVRQAARIDREREAVKEQARVSRRDAYAALINPGYPVTTSSARERWVLANADRAAASAQELRLGEMAQGAARTVKAIQEEFLSRRKDRQQVETVLQAEAVERRMEQERLDQSRLDDWFAATRIRRERDGG